MNTLDGIEVKEGAVLWHKHSNCWVRVAQKQPAPGMAWVAADAVTTDPDGYAWRGPEEATIDNVQRMVLQVLAFAEVAQANIFVAMDMEQKTDDEVQVLTAIACRRSKVSDMLKNLEALTTIDPAIAGLMIRAASGASALL